MRKYIFLSRVVIFNLFLLLVCSTGSNAVARDYIITQITDNNYNDEYPQLNDNGFIVWQSHDGNDWEIYLYDRNNITQVTDNDYDDYSPQINKSGQIAWIGEPPFLGKEVYLYYGTNTTQISGNEIGYNYFDLNDNGHIVWSGVPDGGSSYEIFYYNSVTTTQLTSNTFGDDNADLNNSNYITWYGGAAGHEQIYFYDGVSITQLTSTGDRNTSPRINSNGHITWYRSDGDWEIYLYDGTSISQITNNTFDDYTPIISDNGNIVWKGYNGLDSEVWLYDGASPRAITNNGNADDYYQINDHGSIVWCNGTSHRVMFYDGVTTTQISQLNSDDHTHPQINNFGQIAWQGSDGNDNEIFLYSPKSITLNVPTDYATIQSAIDASINGDTIIIADGTYSGEGNTNLDTKGKSITIQSKNGPENCIIQGSYDVRGFHFNSGETNSTVLSGLTIGWAGHENNGLDGGAIACENNSSPIIDNCIIQDNRSYSGGGIWIKESSPKIQNCTFTRNLSSAIKIVNNPSVVEIINSDIIGNTGLPNGGGVYASRANVSIQNCRIISNKQANGYWAGDGGGVYSTFSTISISESIIASNTAHEEGGGVYAINSSVQISNCLINSNYAVYYGGGLRIQQRYNPGCSTVIKNSTICNNSAGKNSGGLSVGTSIEDIFNCIIWNNTNGQVGGCDNITYSNIQGACPGEGNIDLDPLFEGSGSYKLSANSPCIDAGTTNNAPNIDLEGNLRPAGNGVDMGAYEFQKVDSDQDGVSDDIDNCPNTPNPDQRDLNNDGEGDLCDDDVDGDGLTNDVDDDDDNDTMPDDWENQYDGIDPYLDDSDDDFDNDGFTNKEEYEANSDPTDPDSVPNQPPSAPVQSFPQNGSSCFEPLLKWEASTDPDNDSFHYALSVSEVLSDNSLNEIFSGNVNSDETSFPLGIVKDGGILESGKSYAWTIKAIDQHGNESESGPSYFYFGWKAVNGSWDDSINGTFIPFASDPVNPDNLYIGCHELLTGETGIYKSEDRGVTWTARNNGIEKLGVFTKRYPPIYTISVAQDNPDIVFFGTVISPSRGYVYKSIDGGNNWKMASGEKNIFGTPTINSAVIDIAIDHTNSDIAYAGAINQGVFKTTDGGITWDKIYGGTGPNGAINCYNLIEIHPENNQEIFIDGFTYFSKSVLPNFFKPFSEWKGSNSVPSATGTAPMRMMRSINSGQDWDFAWPVYDGVDYDSDRWALITDLIFDPTINATYFSTIGYRNPLFYNSPNRGILKSLDDGNSWEQINSCCALDLSNYAIYNLIQSENPNRLIASSAKAIFISENNGDTWAQLPAPSNAFTSNIGIAGNRLFALTGEGIFYIDLPSETLSFIDSDCDALSDYIEESGCTDINIADTDQDGLADGEEDINNNGTVDPGETNPCDADTDDDGVNDDTDNCPCTANPDQDDMDNDDIGDLCDDDMDGDGFTNSDEESANSDPENPESIPDRPPSAPKLLFPAHDQTDVNLCVNFKWEPSIDPEGDDIEYCVTVMEDSEPNDIEIIKGCDDEIFVEENFFPLPKSLDPGKKYWWAVWARDNHGNWSVSSEWCSFTTMNRIPQIYGLFYGVNYENWWIQDTLEKIFNKVSDDIVLTKYDTYYGAKTAEIVHAAFLNFPNKGKTILRAGVPISISQIEIDINSLNMKDGDILFLYITSHGSPAPSEGEKTLTPNDEMILTKKVGVLDELFFTDDELYEILTGMDTIEKWVFLDACYSGGFWGDHTETGGDLERLKNICFIATAPEDKMASAFDILEFPGTEAFGLGSYGFHRGFGIDQNNNYFNPNYFADGIITFGEISNHLISFVKNDPNLKDIKFVIEMGAGDIHAFTPDMWQPEFHKSDDFNGVLIVNSAEANNETFIAESGGPYSGIPGAPVTVDASSSHSPFGDIIEYNWDWDNDGVYDETTIGPSTTHTWDTEYDGFLGLKVLDSEGLFAEDISAIEIKYPDADGDGTPDYLDRCPNDPNKTSPGICGCGSSDRDSDRDGVANCNDDCPDDPNKTKPGICGCGNTDTDSDSDGTLDCNDNCPNDENKTEPGVCGCNEADTDADSDGTADCIDSCPNDPDKTELGTCGCGVADKDSDNDGVLDCNDNCPYDASKTEPGDCGCGVVDTDSDNDGTADCIDNCPNDPNKIEPGDCGCGVTDIDTDNDGTVDCMDNCPNDSDKTEAGVCGCGVADIDSDNDGVLDCNDNCPNDQNKIEPGDCGCGEEDIDSDNDGTLDCNDNCPNDPDKTEPGTCGCGVADTDSDGNGIADCDEKSDSDDDSCFISTLL